MFPNHEPRWERWSIMPPIPSYYDLWSHDQPSAESAPPPPAQPVQPCLSDRILKVITDEMEGYESAYPEMQGVCGAIHARVMIELSDAPPDSTALLREAMEAIDALVIFGEQHVQAPYKPLKERYLADRIRSHLAQCAPKEDKQ